MYHSVGFNWNYRNTTQDCAAVLKSGVSSLTNDLWLTTDTSLQRAQTTEGFNFGLPSKYRINLK